MQAICITHLPQIAQGEAHYFVCRVEKEESERTTTGIRRLNPEERIFAIAEMLSGKNPRVGLKCTGFVKLQN
ncbi:hypothetical protein CS542_00655 [Pedobacter sp. IW39]|nr:hypothetical protein CS542_00655 [Pedobacter sp. IW39]